MTSVRVIGVVDPDVEPAREKEKMRTAYSPDRAAVVRDVVDIAPTPMVSSGEHYDYDPCEWLPSSTGMLARCQHGRFDSWKDGAKEQCRLPAARGAPTCSDHGGVVVAKRLLADNAVLMMTELVRIALDPDEKTADKLAAINSGLDRTGSLGRTVAQPEPEVRSALMARLEAAYDQVVSQQAQGQAEGRASAGAVQSAIVAAQEFAELGRGTGGTRLVESSPTPPPVTGE